MMNNKILIAVASIVVVFGFLYGVYAFTNKPVQTDFPEVSTVSPQDHTKWSANKKTILVEYSDLQCPACKMFHDVIKEQIESDKTIKDNVTFVYRHFPLDNAHPHARAAAYAAEAAHNQGKFFEMVDKLFATQETWAKEGNPQELFISYAKELKLDEAKFKEDMNSEAVKKRVQDDVVSGNKVDVQGTPSFYLDGKKVVNINSFEDFKKLLQDTVKNKK